MMTAIPAAGYRDIPTVKAWDAIDMVEVVGAGAEVAGGTVALVIPLGVGLGKGTKESDGV